MSGGEKPVVRFLSRSLSLSLALARTLVSLFTFTCCLSVSLFYIESEITINKISANALLFSHSLVEPASRPRLEPLKVSIHLFVRRNLKRREMTLACLWLRLPSEFTVNRMSAFTELCRKTFFFSC